MTYNVDDYLKEFTVKGEGPYYTSYYGDVLEEYPNAGLNHESLDWTDVPYLELIKSNAQTEFNQLYRFREVGGETFERFQYNVLHKFIQIKRKYNTALKTYLNENLEKIGKISKETYQGQASGSQQSSSSSTDQNTDRYMETPITQLMQDADYETTRRTNNGSSSGSTQSSNSDNSIYTRDITRYDDSVIDYLNRYSDEWRDIQMDFIKEFDVCFFNVVGKI